MNTHIISFMHKKGGVGKSTLSTIMATELSYKGKTKLIDLDPKNQSSSRLRKHDLSLLEKLAIEKPASSYAELYKRTNKGKNLYSIVDFTTLRAEDLRVELEQSIKEGYKYIVVDSPGAIEDPGFIETSKYVQYAFIPLLNDTINKEATVEFYKDMLMRKNKNLMPNLKSLYCIANNFEGSADSLIGFLQEHQILTLRSVVKHKATIRDGQFRTILPLSTQKDHTFLAKLVEEMLGIFQSSKN